MCEADDYVVVGVVSRLVCARKCIEHGTPEDTGCSWTNGSINTAERMGAPSVTDQLR